MEWWLDPDWNEREAGRERERERDGREGRREERKREREINVNLCLHGIQYE